MGALDGTYVPVRVSLVHQARYRIRKGGIATNVVLGVCASNMKFIYVFPVWEGLATTFRILRDVVTRPNGLKVARGKYNIYIGVYNKLVTTK